MFVKNCWYCAGWSDSVGLGSPDLATRKIADESLVLYRKINGEVVALEDMCCHRQAPLSLGRKEGDAVRCMYHGWKFDAAGCCIEIPGQDKVIQKAAVRSFPVVEKNDWIWVWMGDPDKADESLIVDSVGPSHPDWDMRTGYVEVNANYRQEIANLTDLTHLSWVHDKTFGGSTAYASVRPKQKVTPRGLDVEFWVRNIVSPAFTKHLFPEDARFDIHFDVKYTVPCNFILRFRIFSAGTNTTGPSNGELVLDTFSSQSITPKDADYVDYYYSWGAKRGSVPPSLIDLMIKTNHAAFIEDKIILEGQHKRMKEKPAYKMADYAHDSGPGKMLWVLDKLIQEEASSHQPEESP